MRSKSAAERVSELERLCRERGVPLTPQRRVVFETLRVSSDHPTTERIYDRAHRSIPGISTATVYRVLEFLVDCGVALRTCNPEQSKPGTRRSAANPT